MAVEIIFTDGETETYSDADKYKVWTESGFLELREVTDPDPEGIGEYEYNEVRKVNLDHVRDYGWV